MRKIILALLILTIAVGCSRKTSFPSLSKRLYAKNGGANDRSIFKLSKGKYEARRKFYRAHAGSFLKGEIDTLFIMEAYYMEEGLFHGTIWTKSDTGSYRYSRNKLEAKKETFFTDYQLKLVGKWDTVQIRKEDNATTPVFDGAISANAFRCYISAGIWVFDQLYFVYLDGPR